MGGTAIISALGALVSLLVPVLTQIAARWGYKIAMVAAVVALHTACWAAMLALLSASKSLLPASPFTAQMMQFFPSRSVVAAGAGLYLGTVATMKWWTYLRLAFGVAAKVGAA